MWEQLEAGGQKDILTKRRNDSVDRAHQKIEAARKQRLERKQREERQATCSHHVLVARQNSNYVITKGNNLL